MDQIFGAIVWDPCVSPFSIGSFEIRYYALCWLVGLVAAYYVVKMVYKKGGVSEELFDPLFFYCFIGILVGARLGHCLFYEPEYYLANPLEMVLPGRVIDGQWTFTGYAGLASHGGVIGVITGMWLYIRKTKLPFMWVLDSLGIGAPIFAAMVRLGNLMNSEIIGLPTDLPWGFIFVNAGLDTPHHPAQLYESLAYLAVFALVMAVYFKFRNKVGSGLFAGITLFTIFTFRFFIEYIKEVQVDFEHGMLINMGQVLSIPLIILGGYLIYRGIKWNK